MNDRQIRDHVIEELDFEPSVDASNIGVAVNGGVVMLSGHVGSLAQKIAAEVAAKHVKGVRAVAQEIEVRHPNHKQTADDEIARRAIAILGWSGVVPVGKVQITVRSGWVTLSGEVEWHYQKVGAEGQIRKLNGVSGIINSICVRPRAEPSDIKRRIEQAFRRNAELEAHHVQVRVDSGRVILDGFVHDWHQRDVAEKAAWAMPSISAVEDHLKLELE